MKSNRQLEHRSERAFPNDIKEAAVQAHIHLEESGKLSFLRIFEAGAKWQKEQMMEDAVDATVHLEPGANPIVTIGVGRFGLKVYDRVKVIIVKEDIKDLPKE